MLLLHVVVIILCIVHSDGTRCFDCQRLPVPRDCDHVSNCGEHEVCHVTQYVSRSGNIFYDLGCKDIVRCQNKRDINNNITLEDSGDVTVCDKCCDGDFCNVQGCGSAPLPPREERGPVCFNCPYGSLAPEQCEIVASCGQDEQCSIEPFVGVGGDILYRSACKVCRISESVLIGKRGEDCSGCCDTDYCNRNCSMLNPEIYTTTRPSTTTTTTVKPTTKLTTTTTTVAATTTLTPGQKCTAHGYTFLKLYHHCIKVFSQNKDWHDARASCQGHGGDLLVLHNKQDENDIDIILRELPGHHHYWVGANDLDLEGHWVWIDGIPVVTSTYFFPNEPNNELHGHGPDSAENCAEMGYDPRYHSMKLNDDECRERKYYVCEINIVDTCPDPSYTYVPHYDVCYKIYNQTYSWTSARDHCNADNAILLEPTTREEMDYFDSILKKTNSGHYWVGARRDTNTPHQFLWQSTSQHVSNDVWHDHEPNNVAEECASLQLFDNQRIYLLNDMDCNKQQPFICQYK